MHTNTHTHIQAYTHRQIDTYTHTHIHAYMGTYISTYEHTHVHLYSNTMHASCMTALLDIHAYMDACMRAKIFPPADAYDLHSTVFTFLCLFLLTFSHEQLVVYMDTSTNLHLYIFGNICIFSTFHTSWIDKSHRYTHFCKCTLIFTCKFCIFTDSGSNKYENMFTLIRLLHICLCTFSTSHLNVYAHVQGCESV